MSYFKFYIKIYKIPDNLKGRNYSNDEAYREEFKKWVEKIWFEKGKKISELKF